MQFEQTLAQNRGGRSRAWCSARGTYSAFQKRRDLERAVRCGNGLAPHDVRKIVQELTREAKSAALVAMASLKVPESETKN